MSEQLPGWLVEPAAHSLLAVVVALTPVLLFLAALVWSDTFQLVRRRRVAAAVGAGAVGALLSYVVNTFVLDLVNLPTVTFAILVAPFIEEAMKGMWVARQIRRNQIAFLVDAAIIGFATGAGFSLVENIYYLQSLSAAPLVVWFIRGLGTAMMHGSTTAMLAVFLRGRRDRVSGGQPWLAAVLLAALLHATFNRFMTNPLVATGLLAGALPALMFLVYRRSEQELRQWLGRGLDRDAALLALIQSGEVHATPLGRYLQSLNTHFRPEILADMLCLLRLQTELAIRAKGTLILQEQGFKPAVDPELPGKLAEMRWLENNIGRTGLMAMRPVCHWRGVDQWQRELLEGQD